MTSLLVIGECMVEFRGVGSGQVCQGFAGDTYNTAVYAKRWNPELDVAYMTAVGKEELSNQFIDLLHRENIDASKVYRSATKAMGAYMIHTDATGERTFSYWRSDSAAKYLLNNIDNLDEVLAQYDLLYVSGISIAILSDADKATLLRAIARYRKNGGKVAFDPNYRPKLWRDVASARMWFEIYYRQTDIAFPGLDDHSVVFGQQDAQSIQAFMQACEVKESVIKCGKDGVYLYVDNVLHHHEPFKPAPVQVDSTAAGDSFAGSYLAQRIAENDLTKALQAATHVARFVVQHPGAIVDATIFQDFKKLPF